YRALAPRQHKARNAHGLGRGHRLADDGIGLLGHLVVRHQVVGLVVPVPLDRIGGNELGDVDGAGAFQTDRLELLVLDHDVAAFLDLVTADLLLVRNGLAGFGVDVATAHAVAGFSV